MDQQYNSLKLLALLIVVGGIAFAVYHFGGNSGFTGRALNTTEQGQKQSLTENTNDPQFFSSPTILSIIPNVGPTTGLALVTITGTSFSPDITATLDSLPCTNLEYVNDTTIKCKTPGPHSIDIVDVTVTQATGTATLPDGYQYIDAPVTAGSGTIFNNQGGVLSTGGTTSTNSKIPKVSFESDKGIHEEAGTFTVTATLSFTTTDPVTVPFTISNLSTALNPADYSLISANPLIIPANELSGSISFKVINDSSYENDESVMLIMGTPVNATPGDTTHTTMIDDNDVPPTVQWVLASQSGNENVGSMKVEAKLSFQVGVPVTVPFTYIGTGGTASTPADYTMSASPIIIPANTPSYFTTINVVSDPYPEGNETVVVKMGTPINATLGNITTHTVTITDAQPLCQITSFTASPTNTLNCSPTTLSWTTNAFCTSASIDQDIGAVTPVTNGAHATSPLYQNTTFTLTASSASNTTTASTIVTISPSDTWKARANFGGAPRYVATGFSIGNKGYLGTGMTNVPSKDFWEYNQGTNTWTQKADFGGAGRYEATSFSIGDKGYLGTGAYSLQGYYKDFWEYNPTTNTWTQKADFGGWDREGSVGFSIGNKGYLGTGASGWAGPYHKDFWEYNPSTNIWTQKADFGGAPRSEAVGFEIDGKGYVGTGSNGYGNPYFKDFWQYDPTLDTWIQKADFAGLARYDSIGFSLGSKGYIGTGIVSGAYSNDFWMYDPASNIWIQKANFGGIPRDDAAGFAINHAGYIGTGKTGQYMKDFWEYCP